MNIARAVLLLQEANPIADENAIEMPHKDGHSYLETLRSGDSAATPPDPVMPNGNRGWRPVAIAVAAFVVVALLGIATLLFRTPAGPVVTTVTSAPTITTTPPPTTTTSPTTTLTPDRAIEILGEAFAVALSAHDYGAVSALFADGDREIRLLNPGDAQSIVWDPEEIRQDLAFGSVLDENWTLRRCDTEFGRETCRYFVTDEFSRRIGLDPVPVSILFDLVEGRMANLSTNMVSVFGSYHNSMQEYGRWYETNYPGEGAIAVDIVGLGGDPPRAWNFTDLSAAERILARLDEWIASPGFIPPPGG